MIKKILIPIDDRDTPKNNFLQYVTKAFPSAKFYIVSVVNINQRGIHLTDLYYKEMTAGAEKLIKKIEKNLHDDGVKNVKCEALIGLPSKLIVKYAKSHDVDLIAIYVDSAKACARSYRIGSTLRQVLRLYSMPVMVFTEKCDKIPIKKVLFPTDGKRKSRMAKNYALMFSSFYKTELEVFHVVKPNESEERAKAILKDVEWKASFLNVKVKKTLEKGDAITSIIDKILQRTEENDIIIMGIEKRFLFWHFLGKIINTIVTCPSIPVILVHDIKGDKEAV